MIFPLPAKGEADSFRAGFDECEPSLKDIREVDLDDNAQSLLSTTQQVMNTSEIVD